MNETTLLVHCSCPNLETAERIAEALIDTRLAACIQITPTITSLYRWEGKMEQAQERLLLIKTSQSVYSALQQEILSLHPYELPEILAVPVIQGLPGYIAWVNECTEKTD